MEPYLKFDRQAWQRLRQDAPLTITEADLEALHGQIEAISLEEVRDIYLPLSRLLSYYIDASHGLQQATAKFLNHDEPKVPFIIGVSGSVSVGKSTASRVLKTLLARWPAHPTVQVVTTDGFLLSNAELEERDLLNRKGFPESYRVGKLIEFLAALKSGQPNLTVPVYSHQTYDIEPDKHVVVDQPDILILEGLNILQIGVADINSQVYVSDYLDFSIFVDAEEKLIFEWFLQRFMKFRELAMKKPDDFFYQFCHMTMEEAMKFASRVWQEVNSLNLEQNILPYKYRANCILKKGAQHQVNEVMLRKL